MPKQLVIAVITLLARAFPLEEILSEIVKAAAKSQTRAAAREALASVRREAAEIVAEANRAARELQRAAQADLFDARQAVKEMAPVFTAEGAQALLTSAKETLPALPSRE